MLVKLRKCKESITKSMDLTPNFKLDSFKALVGVSSKNSSAKKGSGSKSQTMRFGLSFQPVILAKRVINLLYHVS